MKVEIEVTLNASPALLNALSVLAGARLGAAPAVVHAEPIPVPAALVAAAEVREPKASKAPKAAKTAPAEAATEAPVLAIETGRPVVAFPSSADIPAADISTDDLKQRVVELSRAGKVTETKAILDSYGVERASAIAPEHRADFMVRTQSLL
jgi:hypothetical protein